MSPRRPFLPRSRRASRTAAPPTRHGALALATALLAAPACVEMRANPEEGPFRVAVATFSHETCTFCPGGDTGIDDWGVLAGEELLEQGSYIGGFVKMAREFGDVELVGLESPSGVFGGSSRSWNSEELFEHFMDRMLDDLRSNLPVDGVYLALHGAMGVRNVPRPEAEIARRFREVVGPDVPIVGTFDLHGNEDEEFLRWADGSFVVKRFPHYDAHLQGERAARFLRMIMRGEYVSTRATRKPPVLTATVLGWTGASPAMDIMERARRWEARQPGVFVSVFFGFPWTDVPDIGTTVQVMTNGDQALADHIADDVADFVWRVRESFAHGDFPMPDEAVRRAREAVLEGQTPVAMGDYSDRPGDATWILREIVDQGLGGVLYAALRDEHALDALVGAGARPGDPFDREVGGFTEEAAGSPVRIQGTLRFLGAALGYERVAVVEHGPGNVLILVPTYTQITEPESLRFGPVEPDDFDVIVVKSRAHFRRGFDETGYARTILVVDAPGDWVGTTRLEALPWEFGPIDRMYPFGDPGDWRGRGRLTAN